MTKIVQHSFLGGQLDWEMMGRQDVEKYAKGATLLKNVVLHKRGAAFKRPGTNLVRTVTSVIVGDKCRLVPFASTTTQGWALLFTSGVIYAVCSDGSLLTVSQPTGSSYSPYTGDEIYELDYCQCGDVLYIAHQNHPPAMIRHVVTNGTHTFSASSIDLTQQSQGIPSITKATVSKLGVTNRGPSFTEHYKVTAVFDGVETFPSADYSNSNCADYDSSYVEVQKRNAQAAAMGLPASAVWTASTFSYSGTAYTLPWTESQKISLKINVPTRSDGKRPEQIRIYRKSGSFYGLVGLVNGEAAASAAPTIASTASASTSITDITTYGSPTNSITATNLDAKRFGIGLKGFTVSGTLTLTLSNGSTTKKATVVIKPGHIACEEVQGDSAFEAYDSTRVYNTGDICKYNDTKYICQQDEVTGAWVADCWATRTGALGARVRKYTFRPCGMPKFRVRLGDSGNTPVTVVCATSAANKVFYSTYTSGILSTWRKDADTAAAAWAAGISDSDTLTATVESATATGTITIVPLNAEDQLVNTSFVVYNVGVTDAASDAVAQVPSSVTWEDRYSTPDVSVTPPSNAGVMASSGNYPGCVCLSQQRLIWASTKNDPSRVFMSEIGAFYTYSPHDVQVPDDPIDFQVSATQFPRVFHMAELRKIILFNGASEWIVDSASQSSGITFETIRATQHSCIGSANSLKPIVCNNVLLFAERTGQAVRQYGYELEDDGYGGSDVSIFSQSIFNEKKIVAWAYQQHPHSTCWCVLSDGTLASLTFNREQQCIAWATHELGDFKGAVVNGSTLAPKEARVLDIVCTQALMGNDSSVKDTSEILLLVKRGTDYCIEQFRPESKDETDTPANFVCMDSVDTCTPDANGKLVCDYGQYVVDVTAMQVVSSGVDGVAVDGHSYVKGYVYDTRITTVYPVVAEAVGMAQMDVKNVQYVGLRLMRSVGGRVKNAAVGDDRSVPLVKTTRPTPADGVATIPKVDERVLLPADENRDGRITIYQNNQPFPFGVVMVETDIETEERR